MAINRHYIINFHYERIMEILKIMAIIMEGKVSSIHLMAINGILITLYIYAKHNYITVYSIYALHTNMRIGVF